MNIETQTPEAAAAFIVRMAAPHKPDPERIRAMYLERAADSYLMAEKARATGRKVNGYTAEHATRLALVAERMARDVPPIIARMI